MRYKWIDTLKIFFAETHETFLESTDFTISRRFVLNEILNCYVFVKF